MQVTLENGSLCLRTERGALYAENLSAALQYGGPYRSTLRTEAAGEWHLANGVARCDNVTVTFKPEGQGVLLQTAFCNTGEDIAAVDKLIALTLQRAETPVKALLNRPHRCNGVPLGDMQAQTELVSLFWGTRAESSDFAVIEYSDNANGLFGFVTNTQAFATVEVSGDGVFAASQAWENHGVKHGETIYSDWLYIGPCGPMTEALPAYGKLLKRVNRVPEPRFPVPVGHCSWYYYKDEVTEQAVRENAQWFDARRDTFPIQYIQIDDGWYDTWGDWNCNEKFKNMEALTRDLRDMGFVPGIWFCPLGASEQSQVFRNHPDWFVKGSNGQPMLTESGRYCLDFSQPAPCEYLKSVVRRFTEGWHCGYIKMDIISRALCAGQYADPNFNSLTNLRKCLALVREVAGEKVFLLGCTMPFMAAVGYVDGMRTSGDVFDTWESLPWIFGRVIKRWWMNGTLWWNDADCLFVRTAEEEDADCRRLCSRNKTELQTFVNAMAASSGALMFSDKMALLKPWQLQMMQLCLPVHTNAAVPLDIAERERPALLDFGEENGIRTVAVINWGNRACTFTVPCETGKTLWDGCSGECLGQRAGDFTVTVEPHGSRLFRVG